MYIANARFVPAERDSEVNRIHHTCEAKVGQRTGSTNAPYPIPRSLESPDPRGRDPFSLEKARRADKAEE